MMKKLLTISIVYGILCTLSYGAAQQRIAKCTAYCSKCDPSGITRSGKPLSTKYCAADPKYWRPGTVIKFGAPVNRNYTVEDTGAAVKGRDRFDLCVARGTCNKFGVKKVSYTVIKTSKRHW